MYPILFEIGPIRIASFGLMMLLGFLTGRYLLKRELIRKGFDPDLTDSIVLSTMVGGIGGAKLFYLFENLDFLYRDPIGMIFSGSGLTWYGGLIGGAAAVLWTLHRYGHLRWEIPDAMVPSLIAGYFFGRGGCQLAGDGDYGLPSDLPWAMAYPNGTVPTLDRVHPAPVYEMLEMAILFAILWRLRTRIQTPGVLLCVYLILAGAARFAVEFIRLNPKVSLGLTLYQWISLALIVGGALYTSRLRRRAPISPL